ncbi:MAG TPA: DoxX family protein [Gemmatimonadales bacterium]|jgi:putative oxidoreductase|nr:DoxX family protein [Gemmatimonadales bacterium]
MTDTYTPPRPVVGHRLRHHTPARRWAPALHALLRIGAGLLFMEHGLQKLFGLFGGMGPTGGTAPLVSLMGLAGVLESGGGLLLVLGLFTRPVAVLVLLEMLFAFVTVHLPRGGAPIQNGGELALLYALIFAFLAGNGAGPASLDSRRHD